MTLDYLPGRLAKARKTRRLTQAALAAQAGVPHVMMISGWERGLNLPRIDYLSAMARVLNVSLDWLCGLSTRGGPSDPVRHRPRKKG
jgi:transcriptional regulator with XRE-family HTH domain